MITSIEIAKILRSKNAQKQHQNGFDSALLNLGISISSKESKKKGK